LPSFLEAGQVASGGSVKIVKLQFQPAGKLYDFAAGSLEFRQGDQVVVETERGRSLANVVVPPVEIPEGTAPEGLKQVLRKAEPHDLEAAERNRNREREAFAFCLGKIKDRGMDMKLVKVDYLFDGSKAIFYFTADGRVDFRELVKDLAHSFHTRIEMRQIGVRDEAKMVGGFGICGRELCCSSFLREFAPVSVKMAKEQNLALNPTKISGQCGRLLCCLGYEHETYCELKKGLPKCGKRVCLPTVEGDVIKQNIFAGTCTIRTDDGREVVLGRDEVRPDQICERQKKPGRDQESPERSTSEGRGGRQGRDQKPKWEGKPRSKERSGAPQEQKQATPAPPAPAPAPEKKQEQAVGQKERRPRSRNRKRGKDDSRTTTPQNEETP
jgi:cell fate regulator YaaT (PSP1 superfamily)